MQCIECQEQPANKESGLCDQCESLDEKKINGLLYIPAAGLVINMLISPSMPGNLSRPLWALCDKEWQSPLSV